MAARREAFACSPRSKAAVGLLLVAVSSAPSFAYKIKGLQVRPAQEYELRQEFQQVVIAASPRITQEGVQELFDTRKLLDQKIMPVLVVIDNRNDFAIRIRDSEVFLMDSSDEKTPSIPYSTVLLRISLKKPVSMDSTRPEILLRRAVDKNMLQDFEHKAFGEKLIAPSGSDHGVVFFPLPPDGKLAGYRLYLPEVVNVTAGENLMFFEFELARPSAAEPRP
jgi:hypothetical protein